MLTSPAPKYKCLSQNPELLRRHFAHGCDLLSSKPRRSLSRLLVLRGFRISTRNQLGFSLIEILAVIFLISLIFYVGASMLRSSSREETEQVINSIQRGVRFANDESVIRNYTVRLKILMDKSPQELALEYSTNSEILVDDPSKQEEYLDLEEKKRKKKQAEELNQSFLVNDEFKKNVEEIPESVIIFGAKTADQENVSFQEEFHLYFYPSGIRDQGIIFLGSIDEIAKITIDAVRDKFDVEYRKNPYGLDDVQNIRSFIQEWSKEKK
jgi:prepilin-type N-terminal cleavage/methylation domain-containing protein